MDYIHFNPVKHGLVERVVDWPWSTFHRCLKEELYPVEWGVVNTTTEDKKYGEPT